MMSAPLKYFLKAWLPQFKSEKMMAKEKISAFVQLSAWVVF